MARRCQCCSPEKEPPALTRSCSLAVLYSHRRLRAPTQATEIKAHHFYVSEADTGLTRLSTQSLATLPSPAEWTAPRRAGPSRSVDFKSVQAARRSSPRLRFSPANVNKSESMYRAMHKAASHASSTDLNSSGSRFLLQSPSLGPGPRRLEPLHDMRSTWASGLVSAPLLSRPSLDHTSVASLGVPPKTLGQRKRAARGPMPRRHWEPSHTYNLLHLGPLRSVEWYALPQREATLAEQPRPQPLLVLTPNPDPYATQVCRARRDVGQGARA